jgi:zinc protease
MMMRALLTCLFCCGFAWAAHAAPAQEVVGQNGIKAWLIEEHSLPLVAVHVAFEGSGFAYDPADEEGRANMAAAMIDAGAGDMNERAFTEALENKAIDMNAVVDEDMLEISMQSLAEHREAAFSYLGLVLSKPRFDSDAVLRTQNHLQATIKQAEQDPAYILERALAKAAFGDHPYAKPQLGTASGVSRIDSSDLRDYAARYFTRGNILVSVVGDITPEELKTLLDKYFVSLPEKYKPEITLPEAKIATVTKPITVAFDVPQTQVGFALPGIKRSDPDYIAAYVLNQILSGDGNLVSKLGQEIREKRGLSYFVYSRFSPYSQGGLWSGGFATRTEQSEQAMAVLRDTLERFIATGATPQDLAAAKQYLSGSFLAHLDTNADLAAFLINMQHNKLGLDYLDRRNALINAVNARDIEAVAKRLIDPNKLLIVTVGNPAHAVSP